MKIENTKLIVETKIKENKFYYDCTIYKNNDSENDEEKIKHYENLNSEELEEKVMLFHIANNMTIFSDYFN